MKNYGVLPANVVAHDEQLRAWVSRAYAYARAMPEKQANPRTPGRGGRRRGAART